MIKRIGFACKWIDHPDQCNGIKSTDDAKSYNTGSTTLAWLNRQTKDIAEQKLWDLMVQNLTATYRLVDRVGKLNENLRMVRISSDLLPMYTQSDWSYFWRRSDVISYLESKFASIGDLGKANNIRLSFHPGQFTVLASDNPSIVDKSIEEFEYHADMARWMGYGQKFQDFKINVHIAGRLGPAGIKQVIPRLSTEARNCLTIENDEISWGIEDSLELVDDCALVLDIHHHFIHSGEYIENNDDRIKRIIDSWRGVRPVAHYSVSREDLFANLDEIKNQRLDLAQLLESGYKKTKLRAHSDFMWNSAVNEWALSHLDWTDIMVECKSKNLGAQQLYEFWKQL
jgi:UV damage endonuclease UvdE